MTYVTVTSDPERAVITDADGPVTYGCAPVEASYERTMLEADRIPGRCATVPGFRAKWPSGAETGTPDRVDVCDLQYGATVKLTRPADAPDLEKDLRWALERAQERVKAAEAERDRLQLYLTTVSSGGRAGSSGFRGKPRLRCVGRRFVRGVRL